jgi:16S rRNA (uracil1498-N3)-methyltransferase
MDEVLRRSAAHMLTLDINDPLLSDDALHHLDRVLRLRESESVTITNGKGQWRQCLWTGSGLEIASEVHHEPARDDLEISVTIPKGDRLEWMVQKLVELGVDRIRLMTSERSVVKWDDQRAAKQLDRLRRVADSAIEQSRRIWGCEIVGPTTAGEVLPTVPIAEPGGRDITKGDRAIAIGPEGGWTTEEVQWAAETISISRQVLRVETAAIAAATLMAAQ